MARRTRGCAGRAWLAAVLRFTRHRWREAADRRAPNWPPAWLGFVLGCGLVLVVGVVVLPVVVDVVGLVAGWTDRGGVKWLIAWDLLRVVTNPVRQYFNSHVAGLPVSADALWVAWLVVGASVWGLALSGFTAARVAWALFGLGSVAMVWSQTPRPSHWLAAAIAVAWWTVLAVPVYRRRPVRGGADHRDTPSARPDGVSEMGAQARQVTEPGIGEVARLLDDLARVLEVAARTTQDRPATTDAQRGEEIQRQAQAVRAVVARLTGGAELDDSGPSDVPGPWFTVLCHALDCAPLVDGSRRYTG